MGRSGDASDGSFRRDLPATFGLGLAGWRANVSPPQGFAFRPPIRQASRRPGSCRYAYSAAGPVPPTVTSSTKHRQPLRRTRVQLLPLMLLSSPRIGAR